MLLIRGLCACSLVASHPLNRNDLAGKRTGLSSDAAARTLGPKSLNLGPTAMLRIMVLSAFWLSFVAAPGAAAPTNAGNSATVLLSAGDSQLRQGQYAEALRSFQEALALFEQLSDHRGESKALVGIGLAQMNQRQYAAH